MEWNKAKNILIITFLVLDMVLGVMFFNSNNGTVRIKQSEIEDCRKILKSHNVLLDSNIPKTIKPLAKLLVTNVINTDIRKNKKLFDGKSASIKTIIKNNVIHHYDNYYINGFNCMQNKKTIMKEVLKILDQKQISTKFFELESFKKTSQKVSINFKEIYEGYNIKNCYLEVTIFSFGIITINYRSYIPNGFKADKEALVSPLDSLITVLNDLKRHKDKRNNVRKCSITGINLVYYVEGTDKQNISQTEAIPAWEIKITKIYKNNFREDKKYYINAYENSLLY